MPMQAPVDEAPADTPAGSSTSKAAEVSSAQAVDRDTGQPEAAEAVGAAPTGPTPQVATAFIAPALPKEQLESIVESAGLQWVETTASVTSPEESGELPPLRAPRVRRPRAAPTVEPLEQVETRPGGES